MTTLSQLENRFFTAVAQISIRFRWLVLLASLAVLVGMLAAISSSLRIDTSIESFSETGSQAQQVLEEYRDEFGRDGMYVVVVEGDVYSAGFFEKLAQLHREILGLEMNLASNKAPPVSPQLNTADEPAVAEAASESFGFEDDGDDDGFDSEPSFDDDNIELFNVKHFKVGTIAKRVTSLINARRTYTDEDGSLVVGRLTDPAPQTPADFERIRAMADAERSISGRLVGVKGRQPSLPCKPTWSRSLNLLRYMKS